MAAMPENQTLALRQPVSGYGSLARVDGIELQSESDKRLLRLMRGGNTAAFNELFVRYETRLISYAARYIGSIDLAKDVCQEVFLKLISKPPHVFICDSLAPWLFRVTRNLAIDKRRHRKFEIHEQDTDLPEPQADGDPLQKLTAQDNVEVVRAMVQELPDDLRDVVELRIYGGVSFKEVSSILRIPQGTALWRMHRAVQVLRTKWRRNEEQV